MSLREILILSPQEIPHVLHNTFSVQLQWARFTTPDEIISLLSMTSDQLYKLMSENNLLKRNERLPRSTCVLALIASKYNVPQSYAWLIEELKGYDDNYLQLILSVLNMDVYSKGFLSWSATDMDNLILPQLTDYYTVNNIIDGKLILEHNQTRSHANGRIVKYDPDNDLTENETDEEFKEYTKACSEIEILKALSSSVDPQSNNVVRYYGVFCYEGERVLVAQHLESYWKPPVSDGSQFLDLEDLAGTLDYYSQNGINFKTIYIFNDQYILDDPYFIEPNQDDNPDIVNQIIRMFSPDDPDVLRFLAEM